MALNIGELVAFLKMDKADWDRAKKSAKDDLEDIADEAEKTGKKVDTSTKDTAKKVESNFERSFNPTAFAALFAGLPAAAAGASVAVAGSLALVSGGFIALTAVALAQNTRLAQSASQLGDHIQDSLAGMAEPLAGEYVEATEDIGRAFDRLQPQISAAMRNASEDVDILTGGVIGLAEEAMPGLVVATNRADPVLRGLSALFIYTGRGATDFFMNVSTGAGNAGRVLELLGRIAQGALGFLGQLIANVANNGTPAFQGFAGGLSAVEQMLLAVTAAGSPAYSVLGGFINTANGGLAILQMLVGLLSLLPPGVGQFAGQLLATSKILGAFGINAFAAFDGLGKKIKETEGAGAKLKTGFAGLVAGAFNPVTIAVGLLTFGLGALGQAQQDAAAKAAAHTSRVDDLARSLRESAGVITENTRLQAANTLADFDAGDGKRNLLQDVRNLLGGSGIPALTDAYLGNDEALRQLKTQLQATVDSHYQAASATQLLTTNFSDMKTGAGGTVLALDDTGKAAQQLLDILNDEGGNFDAAVQKNRDLAAASGAAGSAAGQLSTSQKLAQQAAKDLATAFQGLADTEADVTTKGKLLQTVLDTLNGRTPSHEEAIQSINDAIRSLGETFGKGMEKADGWGKALLNADGTVNTATKNGSALQNTLEQLESGFANAGASINDLVKSGVPLEQATKQVSAELTTQRQRFIDAAGAMGITRAQAEQLANKYGLIPTEVTTLITQPGMPNAQQAADILRGKVLAVPDSRTTITKALTQESMEKLAALGYRVTTLPNGTVRVEADTSGAQNNITRLINDNNGKVIRLIVRADGSVRVGGNVMSANGNLVQPFASGGIAAYANGGLRPMSSSMATVVPPNTWRVVGDNMVYPELYAPLNGSARTRSLITEAAQHEGILPDRQAAAVPVQRERALIQIGTFNPPANASPRDIAEELDWLSRTGG